MFPIGVKSTPFFAFVLRVLTALFMLLAGLALIFAYFVIRYDLEQRPALDLGYAMHLTVNGASWEYPVIGFRYHVFLATAALYYLKLPEYVSSVRNLVDQWFAMFTTYMLAPFAVSAFGGFVFDAAFGATDDFSMAQLSYAIWFVSWCIRDNVLGKRTEQPVVRGRVLRSAPLPDKPQQRALTNDSPQERTSAKLFFGREFREIREHHFLFAGMTRSGKTKSMGMLLNSAPKA